MKLLSDRLKFLMTSEGRQIKSIDLARACRVKPPSVADWLNGRTKRLEGENLYLAAKFFKCDPLWLATGNGQAFPGSLSSTSSSTKQPIDLENNPNFPAIRRVQLNLQAGILGYSIDLLEDDGRPIYFSADWLIARGYKPENLIALKVAGESMEPGLHSGDMVVINTADTTPSDGHVFAINYEGEPVIKRMVRDVGSWWLHSDNLDQRRFSKKECVGQGCLVIGKVIHKQSEHI